MIISISHNKKNYRVDTKNSFDISIPYEFNGAQPNYYDVNPGQSTPLISGETIYSVESGAGCNVPEISMNIHCTGTHTECVGHLLENPGDVYILRGMAHTELGEFDEAIDSFTQAIEVGTDGNKRNAEAWIEYVSDRQGS